MKIEKTILIKMIYEAFSEREYPGDDNIIKMPYLGTLGLGDLDDPLPLVGKRWQEIEPDFFWGKGWENKPFQERELISVKALSFLTSEGFRYYLPAYMIMTIEHNDEFADAEYALSTSKNDSLYNWNIERFSGFNIYEVKAIIAFLEYLIELESDFADLSLISLNDYWYARMKQLS